MRRAKIVCTIGPASSSPDVLRKMILAGMNVARLNFSHGTYEDHRKNVDTIRALSKELGRAVSILQDLPGPKIRVGKFENGFTDLEPGNMFTVTIDDVLGNDERVGTTYKGIARDIRPGQELLLDDGLMTLECTEVTETDVVCKVIVGGRLKNNKGINLPNVAISEPSLTKRDIEYAKFGLELKVDYMALSFVRSALDIHMLRAIIGENGPKIIAKIEKPQALEDLDDIVLTSDGIMIARGDLGVELPPEQVPMEQKRALELANRHGCITITATQMLESMTNNPRPTRAEASDVANAVLDGTDAVMLSGETAAGKYPVEAVAMMARIITEVEESEPYALAHTRQAIPHLHTFPNAVARSATIAAADLKAKAIVVFTHSGRTARLLNTYRTMQPIYAFSPDPGVVSQMALFWGVEPFQVDVKPTIDDCIEAVETMCAKNRPCGAG